MQTHSDPKVKTIPSLRFGGIIVDHQDQGEPVKEAINFVLTIRKIKFGFRFFQFLFREINAETLGHFTDINKLNFADVIVCTREVIKRVKVRNLLIYSIQGTLLRSIR
jgi:hypothetical protein